VVAQVAPVGAATDLAQRAVQGGVAGEVQFGGVVQAQDDAAVRQEQSGGVVGMRPQDRGVGNARVVHEVVAAAQGVRGVELVGQRTLGMLGQAVGQVDEAAGAAAVAQIGGGE